MAEKYGADGIVISNHGGRQLDATRPCLDVLLEIRKHAPHLLRPEFRGKTGISEDLLNNPSLLTSPDKDTGAMTKGKNGKPFEILIDGGISRGTEVVKALCLGANAVGLGRGFLFAQSVGGVKGVEHAVQSESLVEWEQKQGCRGWLADYQFWSLRFCLHYDCWVPTSCLICGHPW
jgi:L-lactate dehydrogenase (cytochrome)